MILKLDAAIRDEPWYPSKRPFTEAEARFDLLLSANTVDITLDSAMYTQADRWGWSMPETHKFLTKLREEKFLERDWYFNKEEETSLNRKKNALQVIDLFNSVFNRSIQLNDPRIKMINARFKEGKNFKPPIGIQQFRAVFEFKKKEWENDPDMEKYLTIETLCAAKHFLKYLEAARLDYKKRKQKATAEVEGEKISGVMFK